MQKKELILTALRELFIPGMHDLFDNNVLITVTDLHLSERNKTAHVYLSFLPSPCGYKMINLLEKHKSKIRGLLGNRLANKLRSIPVLKFHLDNTIERAFFIDRLLVGHDVSLNRPHP